jgi:hypothetical protein
MTPVTRLHDYPPQVCPHPTVLSATNVPDIVGCDLSAKGGAYRSKRLSARSAVMQTRFGTKITAVAGPKGKYDPNRAMV